MAAFSSKSSHIRSISLPCRSHPTTIRIEEELNKIKNFEFSATNSTPAEAISTGLSRLGEIYKAMDELLNLPQTIEALSKHQNEKWVDEFLDKSLRVLDICGISKEFISQSKENVREFQSCLRRRSRKGDSSAILEMSIHKYISFRKKMKKDSKKSIGILRQIDQEIVGSSAILDVNQHVSAIIRVLREVNSISILIFQSVLAFLSSAQSLKKSSKWSLVSRLIHKGKVASFEDSSKDCFNEFESVDVALRGLCRNDGVQIQTVQSRLESLEGSIESVENELEAMFRCLIRSRTCLLNVFSC